MSNQRTLALAQANFTVGDLAGNTDKILQLRAKAAGQGADLVVFPEMAITGYPPEDLVLRRQFQDESMQAAQRLAAATGDGGPAILTGGLWREEDKIYNAAFLLADGKIHARSSKVALPNYGVFDEKRLFASGSAPLVTEWKGIRLGILVCEDLWRKKVRTALASSQPDITCVINASPYEMGKSAARVKLAGELAKETAAPVVYLNLIGGQDELVFDGRSFILDEHGNKIGSMIGFDEELAFTRWENKKDNWTCVQVPQQKWGDDGDTIYRAMMLGLRDYVEKNRFPGVIIALSGGVDSAITAAVAVDALGSDRVRSVLMPSPYTSQASVEDATECAKRLGIPMDTIAITPAMELFDETLNPLFTGRSRDETEENIQARLRANFIMAISNKLGLMVVTTGNKSEMSVGYATLYGDMCGGYSVLKDVYKTTVYRLSRWRNANLPQGAKGPARDVIPERVITKPPSAELKHNQTDQDTLPPYEILDKILLGLIEGQQSSGELVEQGFDRDVVSKVMNMLFKAEYKRRQSPPGVKITGMSFGRDRRYPITNRFRG